MSSVSGGLIPGGPIINEQGVRLRLTAPNTWHRLEIDIPSVPPSMNDNRIRSHWRGFQEEKKLWQDEIEILLMSKRGQLDRAYQRAMAGAWMRFSLRAPRRDSGNYSSLVGKALGDALTTMGLIPDDDDHHFFFGGVEFEGVRGADRTLFVIFLQPKEQE